MASYTVLLPCFWLLWFGFGISITRLQLHLVQIHSAWDWGGAQNRTCSLIFVSPRYQNIVEQCRNISNMSTSFVVCRATKLLVSKPCWPLHANICKHRCGPVWFGTQLAFALPELRANWKCEKACGHQTPSQNSLGLVPISSLCLNTWSISSLILSGNLINLLRTKRWN